MSRGMAGVFDNPRTRRLTRDFAQMKALREESDILDFEAVGDPPEKYVITFRGTGLEEEGKTRKTHKVELTLGPEYPRNFPQINWKTPIYHPNISGGVCLGTFTMTPYVKLTDLVEILWDMTRMANWNPYSVMTQGPWQELNRELGFPLDARILRNLAPPAPPPAVEDEGEMMILEGPPRGEQPAWMKRPPAEDPGAAARSRGPQSTTILAAGLLIIRSDRRVLLLRRSAVVSQPGTWGPPGGKVEQGETAVAGAMREAEEEMGPLPRIAVTGDAYQTYQGRLKFVTIFAFMNEDVAETWKPQLNEENDEWGWFSNYNLPEDLVRGSIDAIHSLMESFQKS